MPVQQQLERSRLLAAINIAVAGLVVALKYWAYLETHSVALYSDALESIVNVMTAVAAAFAVRLAAQPPDRHHQFGHHKAEYLAAVTEGVLIVLAAILIIRAAAAALASNEAMHLSTLGIGLNVAALILNGGWAWVLIKQGRVNRSPALVADGWHLVSDVTTSVGVILGLLLAVVTGWQKMDAILALVVASYILWTGGRLLRESMSGLMDEAVTNDVSRQIRAVIAQNGEGAIEVHEIRTRIAGRVTFIEFHLVVPGRMTVRAAHDICDRLEAALVDAQPGSEVIIHIEPEGEAGAYGAIRF